MLVGLALGADLHCSSIDCDVGADVFGHNLSHALWLTTLHGIDLNFIESQLVLLQLPYLDLQVEAILIGCGKGFEQIRVAVPTLHLTDGELVEQEGGVEHVL